MTKTKQTQLPFIDNQCISGSKKEKIKNPVGINEIIRRNSGAKERLIRFKRGRYLKKLNLQNLRTSNNPDTLPSLFIGYVLLCLERCTSLVPRLEITLQSHKQLDERFIYVDGEVLGAVFCRIHSIDRRILSFDCMVSLVLLRQFHSNYLVVAAGFLDSKTATFICFTILAYIHFDLFFFSF